MRKLTALVLTLLLLFGLISCQKPLTPSEQSSEVNIVAENDIIILFTSDVHSAVDSGWTYSGIDVIRRELIKKGNKVVLVDNGDSVQGEVLATMTDGEAIIKLMNAVGYDIAIMGNHEFDYGMDKFFELVEMADFPYISCNFNRQGEPVFESYVIKEIGGVKLAFVGITTPWTLKSSTPKYFMDDRGNYIYGFMQGDDGKSLYSAVQKAVDDARAEGADYVIAMAHLGNEAELSPYTYADILSNTTGIDALVDGHSHDTDRVEMKNKAGETVYRIACGTKLEAVGYVRITPEGEIATGLYRWQNSENAVLVLGLESYLNKAIADAKNELSKALSQVVAKSNVDLLINDPGTGVRLVRNQETAIGNLCADAFRYVSGADIAFANGGGVRNDILKGDITKEDILKVHPFGNMLCVCEATGQEILDALEFSASAWPSETGGWICPSGISYEIHTYIPSGVVRDENGMFVKVDGEYRVKNVLVGGQSLDLNKTYTLAAHNYMLQNMGDGYTMFTDNVYTQDCVMIDNQVLITYITEGLKGVIGEEYAEPQGRITFVEEQP
ncbi:MAG: bifunctional metallophosphatase/5'-nucleotidase [Clostridiales bacterium]|nr:bifunctional metallophosphatase/5'-nucleotidase [Clostridiales bacterium]